MWVTQETYEELLAGWLKEYEYRWQQQMHEEVKTEFEIEFEIIHLQSGKKSEPVKAKREVMAPGEATRGPPPGTSSASETINKNHSYGYGRKRR